MNRPFSFNQTPIVAIVGAREVKHWILQWMENELLPIFEKSHWTVLSGGARGVDQKAHGLALRAQQKTVIVLPSSIQNIYPKSLKAYVNHPGAYCITEYPEDKEFHKYHFHQRNAWIVGLSQALFVVQAAEKSGSMITARIALDAGVPVATLPASPMERSFHGNNQLIYEGASVIRNGMDFMAFLNLASSNFFAKEKVPMETSP